MFVSGNKSNISFLLMTGKFSLVSVPFRHAFVCSPVAFLIPDMRKGFLIAVQIVASIKTTVPMINKWRNNLLAGDKLLVLGICRKLSSVAK
jgi:hypothetical protein